MVKLELGQYFRSMNISSMIIEGTTDPRMSELSLEGLTQDHWTSGD